MVQKMDLLSELKFTRKGSDYPQIYASISRKYAMY